MMPQRLGPTQPEKAHSDVCTSMGPINVNMYLANKLANSNAFLIIDSILINASFSYF